MLLVNGGIPTSTATELKRLVPAHIYVLGSDAAVSAAIQTALVQYTASRAVSSVTRLGGADRYATAVRIAQATYSPGDPIYVANGENFPDALAGAPLGGPLLLVPDGDTVPQVVLDEVTMLAPPSMIVLGGPTRRVRRRRRRAPRRRRPALALGRSLRPVGRFGDRGAEA